MHAPVFLLLSLLHVVSLSYGQECKCGIESVNTRIINGRESVPYTYPWVVYIQKSESWFRGSACTGSLISENFVLTAAHCVPEDGDVKSMFISTYQGCDRWHFNWDFRNKYPVKRIIRHPGYGDVTNGNDIALLELKSPVKGVTPICLPKRSVNRFSNLVVAGWGMVGRGLEKVDSKCLNEVELAVVGDWTCVRHYGVPSNRVMCAGGKTGVCQGDSGGPLMTRVNGLVFQAGVTSFTRDDCGIATETPAGFEKVSAHLTWISSNSRGACFK